MAATAIAVKPRRRPQQGRSHALVERILDAAARVFADVGYAAGTTNRIAAEADVSIGSLYQYFADKDQIVGALVRRHIDDGVRLIGERLADPEVQQRPLIERTRIFVQATVDLHRDQPVLHRVLFEESPRPPDVLAALRDFETITVQAIEQILADDPDVTVTDIPLAAYLTFTTIESVTHRYVSSHPDSIDADALVDELTALVAGYLTRQPPRNRASEAPRQPGE